MIRVVGVEFGAPKAGALPNADRYAVRDLYSNRIGFRPLGKRVNPSMFNFQTGA